MPSHDDRNVFLRKIEFAVLILAFLTPFILASKLFFSLRDGSTSIQTQTHGHVFKPGEHVQYSLNNKWTVIHCTCPSSDRYTMWKGQILKMMTMLGPLADHVDVIELAPEHLHFKANWDKPLIEGALLLVDHQGYLALGYDYHKEPKRAFIEVKKLLKATV